MKINGTIHCAICAPAQIANCLDSIINTGYTALHYCRDNCDTEETVGERISDQIMNILGHIFDQTECIAWSTDAHART